MNKQVPLIVTNELDSTPQAGFITCRIHYSGNVVSLNDYKSLHWRKLKVLVDGCKLELRSLIRKARVPKLKYIELRVFHNTRYDMDNIVGVVKPFVDMLRKEKRIAEDNKGVWDYLSIQYAPQLKKNELVFEIKGEKQ